MKIERWVDSEDLAFVALGVAIGAVAILAFQASSSCELEAHGRTAVAAPASVSFPFAPNDEAHSRDGGVIVEKARADACRDLSAPECRNRMAGKSGRTRELGTRRILAASPGTGRNHAPDAQIPKDE